MTPHQTPESVIMGFELFANCLQKEFVNEEKVFAPIAVVRLAVYHVRSGTGSRLQ
jgi:hypothetical protein